jgi:hypothetical protein
MCFCSEFHNTNINPFATVKTTAPLGGSAGRPDVISETSRRNGNDRWPADSINGFVEGIDDPYYYGRSAIVGGKGRNRSSVIGGEPESMALPAVVEPPVPPTTRKESSMRKWGPAVLALGMALVMHAILFHNNEIPTASLDRSRRKLALISDRVAAMDRMEEAFIKQMGLTGQFSARDRSGEEDEPSVMLHYTRRRHRYLGDQYTHLDRSADFTSFGKISTCLGSLSSRLRIGHCPLGVPGLPSEEDYA